MNLINQINGFLAKSIGLLNALLAILLVGFALMVGVWQLGTLGIFVGLLVGTAMAVLVCGLLALVINIRNLLAESLEQRPSRDGLGGFRRGPLNFCGSGGWYGLGTVQGTAVVGRIGPAVGRTRRFVHHGQ